MEIKINIEKRHFFVLLGVVLLFGIVFYVKAAAVDTSVFHGIDQIDWNQMLPRLGVEGSVGIGTNDPTEGGIVGSKFTIRPNTATGLAIMRSDGERAFALNPNADGSWTAYDGVSGWVPGITQSGGNVGVGTSSPQARLDVNGDIRTSTGLKGAAWVGYKWVPDGAIISCRTHAGTVDEGIHEARVNSGNIEVRVRYARLGTDSGWRNRGYAEIGSTFNTILFEDSKVDLVGNGLSNTISGGLTVCTANWP